MNISHIPTLLLNSTYVLHTMIDIFCMHILIFNNLKTDISLVDIREMIFRKMWLNQDSIRCYCQCANHCEDKKRFCPCSMAT